LGKKHYEWIKGSAPPVLGQHSLAKHKVLQAYLEKYVSVLTKNLAQDCLKLTLVDGFSGGGVYRHPTSMELIPGSPIIMLNAMMNAETQAQELRHKEFLLDAEYFFIEKSGATIEYLRNELREHKHASDQGERVKVLQGDFAQQLEPIIQRVESRGRSRRVIFVLDQYGYSDVSMKDLKLIFSRLPNAEVILTIAIDWLIDHWTEKAHYDSILSNLGLGLDSGLAKRLKSQNPVDWRPLIQFELHDQLFLNSGSAFYTPFFIRSVDAHRSYWLLHFSGHEKARDVMMELHWELQNHFQHFGSAGLAMLGYDPRCDLASQGQLGLKFDFDQMALDATRNALIDDIPRRLKQFKNGLSFNGFFRGVVNGTPATRSLLLQQASELSRQGELEIRTREGKLRKPGVQIADDDIILRPKQEMLFRKFGR